MKKDYPSWLTNPSADNAEQIEADLLAAIKQTLEAKGLKGGELETAAILAATKQAKNLEGDVQRAFYRLIWKVADGQLFHFDDEIETLGEWLSTKFTEYEPGTREHYDVLFLLEQFFPMVQGIPGWSVNKLLSMQGHWTRTIRAIPFLRKAINDRLQVEDFFKNKQQEFEKKERRLEKKLERAETPVEEREIKDEIQSLKKEKEKVEKSKPKEIQKADVLFSEKVERALEVIADETIPSMGPKGINKVLAGETDWDITVMEGTVIVRPDEEADHRRVVFYIEADPRDAGVVRGLLEKAVSITTSDPEAMLQTFGKLILNSSKKGTHGKEKS